MKKRERSRLSWELRFERILHGQTWGKGKNAFARRTSRNASADHHTSCSVPDVLPKSHHVGYFKRAVRIVLSSFKAVETHVQQNASSAADDSVQGNNNSKISIIYACPPRGGPQQLLRGESIRFQFSTHVDYVHQLKPRLAVVHMHAYTADRTITRPGFQQS